MKKKEHVRILVVGDIMLDKYIQGTVNRICPEAPVPILNVTNEYHSLGGCGNVVRNLRTLGVKVDCIASIGPDNYGERILDELNKIGAKNLCLNGSKQTIVKERIIADDRKVQMLRVDREDISTVDYKKVIEIFEEKSLNNYDIVIVSDYAKGMITKELMTYLKKNVNADIIVDPKPINGFLYDDVMMITPNEKEWQVMELSSQYSLKNVKYILETKGKNGMILHDQINSTKFQIKSDPVDVYNVSGAGDTVISIMGLCLSIGFPVLQSASIANYCASYVVTQPGTSTVPETILNEAFSSIF